MALSKKTLAEFREYLATWTLAKIRDLFESEDIAPSENYKSPHNGQRQSLADSYLQSITLINHSDVGRVLKAFEHVLVTLSADVEDNPGTPTAINAERSLKKLLRWLHRDGFTFEQGRLASVMARTPEVSSPVMPKQESVAEPAIPASFPASPTAFVSYSWDDEEHKQWVLDFATRIRHEGIDAKLDRWDVSLGDPLPQFMETAVRANDFVLIILTPKYREKSDGRKGGVGYEGNVMTAEIFAGKDQRKFIPILRQGSWETASPSWLQGKLGVDLRGNPYSEKAFSELRATLHRTRAKAPPLGPVPKPNQATEKAPVSVVTPLRQDESEPLRILHIITSNVGTPRNDGTRGSALYAVPFQLSRRPSQDWAEHFVRTWDRPPSSSTRHRPRIARVEGDRIILDGTTIEEVAEVHRDTLKDVLEKVNGDIAEHERRQRRIAEQNAEEIRQHKQSVSDAARRLSFDDLSVDILSLYYQDVDEHGDSVFVVTSCPRRFQAELGLTNNSSQTVYIKSITLRVAGRVYERERSTVLRIEPREYKEIDATFPANDNAAIRAGDFELEFTPAVGGRTKVTGSFPVEKT